jgi:MATE family multidrug resistance protein
MNKYLKKSFYKNCKPHYLPNLKLALPVVFSQGAQMLVGLVDTLMVGQLGAVQLAAVALANSILILGLMASIGFSVAVTPLVGKAHGAGRKQECSLWLKQGLVANVIVAFALVAVMIGVGFLMPYMGQEKQVVDFAMPYYILLVVSIVPFNIFMVFKQFAEGITNTRIAMVISLVANVLNVILNYLLIFGKFGFPNLGMDGAGWATLIARVFTAIAFIFVFARLPYFSSYKKFFQQAVLSSKQVIRVLKIGFPIGGQMVIEVFAFSMGAIMMGWMNAISMAAHQIVITLASFTYMMSLGLSTAATIRVSNFRGAGDFKQLNYSAYAIVHKVIVFMAFNGILFILLREVLPPLFVNDVEVLKIATQLMIIAGIFQLFDGLQAVWLAILRGLEDVKIPSVISFITWIVLALPICYICAFVLEMGAVGIWIGYLSGLGIASLLLRYRYKHLYKTLFTEK